MSAPFRVKALYEYTSAHEDDLSFPIGQVITVTQEEDDEWYEGEYVDDSGMKNEGIFPRNFVEKFEPTAPPRPTRSRPKKEPEPTQTLKESVARSAPPHAAAAESHDPTEEPEVAKEEAAVPTTEDVAAKAGEQAGSDRTVPPAPVKVATKPPPEVESEPRSPTAAVSPPAPKPAPAAASKPKAAPPPVSEKPSSNSFKDRIAAFNKPAAPPIAPFKPGGLSTGGSASGGSSTFIKKPFVPPPPSRDAYVPVAKEKPTATAYRREEDPEIKEQEAEVQEQAEKAGLVPSEQQDVAPEEDQPKPTSLKERIALLQKQQMEQAQRHADAAAKREKPKKPAKKRSEDTAAEATEGPLSPTLERADTHETEPRVSIDEAASRVVPPPPPRRKASKGPAADESHDGNEADMSGAGDTTEGHDDTTEREDNEDAPHRVSRVPTSSTATGGATHGRDEASAQQQDDEEEGGEEGEEEDEGEEDEEEMDPEVKRKEELRARMAKMSGGMGFHGMFGAPMPPGATRPPPKRKPSKPAEPGPADDEAEQVTSRAAPPVPTPMVLPGMGGALGAGRVDRRDEDDDSEDEEDEPATRVPSRPGPPPVPSRTTGPKDEDSDEEEGDATTPAARPEPPSVRRVPTGPPPIPSGRPVPPAVPTESRAPPPPPPGEVKAPTEGSESDDELSGNAKEPGVDRTASQVKRSPPMPPQPAQAPSMPPRSPPMSPRSEDVSTSSSPTTNKRASRPPPPVPGSAPAPPPATSRPPPPPPPGSLSRQSTAEMTVATPTRPPQAGENEDEEITEYEGDYDTDIGSSVPHKDALKAHARDSSLEDNSLQSPTRDAPPSGPPPIPGAGGAPRGVPPPIPSQLPVEPKRRSTDAPRGAPPPPPPPSKETSTVGEGGDYDPYNYASSPPVPPMGSGFGPKTPKIDEEGAYFTSPASASLATSPPVDRRAPPPAPFPGRPGNRASVDMPRTSTSNRRSLDAHRLPGESGFIANDIDLSAQSGWWKQPTQVPPVFQGRKDIHFEFEESTTTNQGSKTVVTRDIYVLFQDYSQTVVTVRYDPYDPSDAALDQRHEAPPRPLRQDEMEEFYERFGRQIAETASAKKDTVVGEGAPQSLVWELFKPLKGALAPVGTRAYGALVYANMANASTQQQDVIRAGDIISFRNAKFQGKHGPMHAKYSAEVGKPDHVAVVAEWDGTKKKVRAWEQGRENKKVKQESYKLDDLRSGEVKIWRVVPRSWVGWNVQP